MGFLDSLKSWLRSEGAEARQLGRETKGRLQAELDRREADLTATPEQRLERLQEQIAEGGSGFDDLQSKIDGRAAHAEATADLADRDPDESVLDLESEEIVPPEQPPAS